MTWSAIAPSNLALIKYMGKKDFPESSQKAVLDSLQNKPESTFSNYLYIPLTLLKHLTSELEDRFWFENMSLNPSLSWTLSHFISQVKIEESFERDTWKAFENNVFEKKKLYQSSHKLNFKFKLSLKEQKRFLDFFYFLKKALKIPGYYQISSQNNFPKSTGIASSSSSFSALTMATYKLALDKSLLEKDKFRLIKKQFLAHLSRVGSGSSCRSFFSPWCLWDNYKIYSFETPFSSLSHQLILIELTDKKISSSLAHQRVKTSSQFSSRAERAFERLNSLKTSFNLKDWSSCFSIVKEEFLDMHSLFESSLPAFSYQNEHSQKVIDFIKDFWKKRKDGPLMTMDAGSNVHLLYRKDQKNMRVEILKSLSEFNILTSL
ncbi:MAG: hypothetical protein GDA46_06640 [Bdellovibrionales bacterium]|nr:hypothetical protein [Bdellovibrionales bacterium]